MISVVELLRDLVALPSVNPLLLPPKDARAGEERVVAYLESQARAAGLDRRRQEVHPGRCNLLLTLPARGKARRRVVLAPHTDTVGAPEEGFCPRQTGDRLYGRGTCDTKGSLAAMFTALCAAAESPTRPAETEIVLAALVDEEVGQTGSRALVASGFKADFALVGEPTRLRVVTAHKGDLWLSLETRGKAAHGAMPDLGRNAIHEMAGVVNLLLTRYAANLRRQRHPLLGSATVSVGTIQGGAQPNIVPDRCAISIDRRTLPGETEATVRRELQALFRSRKLRVTILNSKDAPCPALETDAGHPLVRQLLAAARQRQSCGVHYFCDAAVLAQGGIPSVVFGPGDIAQAHTTDEWISLRSVERASEVLTRFLRGLP